MGISAGTLLMAAATTHAVSMSLYAKLGYDLEKDLVPVSLVANVPHILVAHPSVPGKNLAEVIAFLKSQGGKVNFASQGNGTLSHLEFELMKSTGGFSAIHVPYKGSAPALVDLLAGNVQIVFSDALPVMQHIRAGKLRALAVTSPERSPLAPDIPTCVESGMPGLVAVNWWGVFLPAGTPKPIADKFHADLIKVMQSADVKEKFANLGVDAVTITPAELGAYLKSETVKYAKLIKEAGIKGE